jgi:predicted DCC family thiol-disulfide oxidoreductase YuxK
MKNIQDILRDEQVILFDGVCRLCNGWAQWIIKIDKSYQLKLCSVQSEAGQALLRHLGYPTDKFDTMVVIANQQVYEKSDAFFVIMKRLGFPYRLLLIGKIMPKFIRNWLYDRIAQNRYRWFGQYESCPIDFSIDEKRFL